MNFKNLFFFLLLLSTFQSCDNNEPMDEDPPVIPNITVEDVEIEEGTGEIKKITFEILLSEVTSNTVSVEYTTRELTAEAGQDYQTISGFLQIAPGALSGFIEVELVTDSQIEEDEQMELFLIRAQNGTLVNNIAIATILNDDDGSGGTNDGYITPTSYPGMSLVWSDEFNGTALNQEDWTYETGDNGWGNNELQNYQSGTNNATVGNGRLTIEARQSGSNYTSARIKTQGKQFFKHGRIDIRAKLPQGQGIWPALWMLGESFTSVGWPTCGEIDIMELLGHDTDKSYGTCHWYSNGPAKHEGCFQKSSGSFTEEFHVFSLIWTAQEMSWYVNDVFYHNIDISSAGLSAFQEEFFFIFNVAVGGNWPGNPNSSTQFPQTMEVDYVRVFQ